MRHFLKRILKQGSTGNQLILSILLIGFILPVLYGNSKIAKAAENQEKIPHVNDNAGLLSTSEIEKLEKMCITYGEEAGIEIFILTHDDPNAEEPEKYIEDFNQTLPEGDQVILLIDMNDRFIWIQGYGLAETYIHSKRIDEIYETMKTPMADGNYFEAFEIYIKKSAAYMQDDTDLNWDHDYSAGSPQTGDVYYDYYGNESDNLNDLWTSWWFQLIVSLILAGSIVGMMAYHSSGKMTAGGYTYMDRNHSGLIGRRDQYLQTRVTKVRRPKENTTTSQGKGGGFNSSGFRGGVSSGGRSHSSGGGRF